MHEDVTSRRFDLTHIRQALLAFLVIAGMAVLMHGEAGATSLATIDAATLDRSIDSGSIQEQIQPSRVADVGLADGEPRAAMDLGTSTVPVVVHDYTFLEMNVHLPGSLARPTASDFWFIELNRYGEDFAFEAPIPASHYPGPDGLLPPRRGVVMY